MIVKNESKVIRRMLESVVDLLDSYCICDTGSTDDTKEIIQAFFQERNIPGYVFEEPFRDFGYNRTVALEACTKIPHGKANFILLMDADMILSRDPKLTITELKSRLVRFRAFLVYQGTDTYHYKNVRIIKNNLGITYWGVTHEYVKMPEELKNTPYGSFSVTELFIRDIGDGGSKSDKFQRDIRLLQQGLVELPNNDRYTYYLANSYRDNGELELAIETYQKRIDIGGWIEEMWQSNYAMGCCYQKLDNMPCAIFTWLEGYHIYGNRIENLYEIIQYYRKLGKNELAYQFYQMADDVRTKHTGNQDHLFTQMDVYEYKLDYEFSILGYYCNPKQKDLSRVCMKVLKYSSLEDSMYKNVLSNYKFYAPDLARYALPMCTNNVEALSQIGREKLGGFLGEYMSSTPSMCIDAKTGDLVICVRYVNYRINDEGGYEGYAGGGQTLIGTKNVLARFSGVTGDYEKKWIVKEKESELVCDSTYNDGRYRGLEDVRLFSYDKYLGIGGGSGRIIYNANRGLDGITTKPPSPHDESVMTVEHGWIVRDSMSQNFYCTNAKLLKYPAANPKLEKNWVLFGMEVGDQRASVPSSLRTGTEDSSEPPKVVQGCELRSLTLIQLNSKVTLSPENSGRIQLKCVYSWRPLVLGTICPTAGTFTETHRFEEKTLPYFFKDVRCSTCGVKVGTEIWFIGHLVSYEDRRYYYHIMIVLDGTTLALKKYTTLWTFNKEKVEYTLGMVFFPEYQRFLIGYSVMDRETKYMMVSKHIFDDRMIIV